MSGFYHETRAVNLAPVRGDRDVLVTTVYDIVESEIVDGDTISVALHP